MSPSEIEGLSGSGSGLEGSGSGGGGGVISEEEEKGIVNIDNPPYTTDGKGKGGRGKGGKGKGGRRKHGPRDEELDRDVSVKPGSSVRQSASSVGLLVTLVVIGQTVLWWRGMLCC